jgi:hypothetical protein
MLAMQRAALNVLGLGVSLGVAAMGCDHAPVEHAAPVASAAPAVSVASSALPPLPVEASAPAPVAAEASAPAPLPAVTVENIGMHIGGGPNDAVTKAPIGGSVAPHFDELRACWAQVDPPKGGDFGVDLLIPAEGGRAEVSHPRSILGPQAFRDCVVGVFTAIDFAKPRTGRTTVSYALRFTPGR